MEVVNPFTDEQERQKLFAYLMLLLFSFFTERPARQNSKYLEENALQDAPSHFATALKCAASYKIWQLSAFRKVAITIATALLTVPPAAIKNFIDIIAQKLTIAIGPLSAVQPSDREGNGDVGTVSPVDIGRDHF